ncbi:conserved hypothetical protein [Theileria equi strain WA]|uniref:Uncharacterized protein n=1 Tax=Theileria equi strain WA TaxID=1537102 RepID=L1LBN2_THEEQ|nr:conserved hypothetical protein [Theileria equi strain WA]EKX72827.1 conserved hypothetical protein [Theileria equi strain WA]|eukprot:XP_004832279.1 conserved hypothetical protein [Theileria equi strain WA]
MTKNGTQILSDNGANETQETLMDSDQNDDPTQTPKQRSEAQSDNLVTSAPNEDEEEEKIEVGHYSANRKFKDRLVARLLCRWWYVFPDWPPSDFDYNGELSKRKLKLFKIEEFENQENVDSNGYGKVYELSAFPGVFRDYTGQAHDLRPLEGKPCYNNFVKYSEAKLLELVETAINNQLKILENSTFDEAVTIRLLKEVCLLQITHAL